MKNHYKIVDRYKAEKLLRFINFIIDYLFNYLLVVFFYAVLMFVYSFISGILPPRHIPASFRSPRR